MLHVTDQMGRNITLPARPQRIVSLVPSITELLFDLGLGNEVVGVTRFCVHPEQARQTARNIGGTKKIHHDRIAALQPDLIIGSKEENTPEDIERLWHTYPVWMSDVKTISEGIAMIVQIGELCRRPSEAQHMAQEIEADFDKLKSSIVGQPNIRAAYLIWHKPMMVCGTNNFIGDVMRAMGLHNVFDGHFGGRDGTPRYPAITAEELAVSNADVVLLSSEPFPFKDEHIQHYQTLLPHSTVTKVDGELFSWYGSRMAKMPGYLRGLRGKLQERLP